MDAGVAAAGTYGSGEVGGEMWCLLKYDMTNVVQERYKMACSYDNCTRDGGKSFI